MAQTIRCARDGKEYPANKMYKIGGVFVAEDNLTEAERLQFGVKSGELAAPEAQPGSSQPDNQDQQTDMGESNLNAALQTPVEELTEEQKQLIRDNAAALTDEERARYAEAGVIPSVPASAGEGDQNPPSSEGGDAGDSTPPSNE